MADIERVCDTRCALGENPLWHPAEQRLYWTDIPRRRLYRFDPATSAVDEIAVDAEVGGFTLQEDGALLLFMARGVVQVWRDGTAATVLAEHDDERESRFNDVIAEPRGSVLCGTLPSPSHLGSLYRLDVDRSLTRLLDGIGCSNGLGFSPDLRTLYYTDTRVKTIYVFDYHPENGALERKRVFVEMPDIPDGPDGLTVDADGFVWSARWGASCLQRFDPHGVEQARYTFPTRNVTSLTFGGPDLTDIYVTTAGGDRDQSPDGAGALYRLRCGAQGVAEFRSRVA